MDWSTILVALVGAVLGGGLAGSVVVVYKARAERDKTEAETTESLTASAMSIVQGLERRVCDLEKDLLAEQVKRRELERRVAVLERERAEYRRGALMLHDQVIGLGAEPVWKETCGSLPDRGTTG